jgi:uncharacterized Zn finger protein
VDATESGTYLGACAKHLAERASAKCEDCGDVWCDDCLVPKTRKRQPVRCIDCALVAAGVRLPGSRRTSMSMSRNRTQKFM